MRTCPLSQAGKWIEAHKVEEKPALCLWHQISRNMELGLRDQGFKPGRFESADGTWKRSALPPRVHGVGRK